MHRHERHPAVFIVALAVERGLQRHLLQKVGQSCLPLPSFFLPPFNKLLNTTQKLLHILLPGKIFRCPVGIYLGSHSTFFHNSHGQGVGIVYIKTLGKALDKHLEVLQFGQCGLAQHQSVTLWLVEGFPKAHS